METTDIARVCHEANRALQVIQADPTIPVGPPWDELDMETRASAVNGVGGVLRGNTPQESHENWAAFKSDAGWTWGPVKDEVMKTHPLLVHYEDLPPEAQLKDDLFVAVVHACAGQPHAGVQA